MCINIKPHSFSNFSGCKNGATAFFLTRFSSQSLSQRQVLGQRARSFGRWWRHELCVRVQMMLSLLSLRSCRTSVDELKQHLLGDRVGDAVAHSHGSVVCIRKTFVCSLSHEDPAVILKFAFYNFVVILF